MNWIPRQIGFAFVFNVDDSMCWSKDFCTFNFNSFQENGWEGSHLSASLWIIFFIISSLIFVVKRTQWEKLLVSIEKCSYTIHGCNKTQPTRPNRNTQLNHWIILFFSTKAVSLLCWCCLPAFECIFVSQRLKVLQLPNTSNLRNHDGQSIIQLQSTR